MKNFMTKIIGLSILSMPLSTAFADETSIDTLIQHYQAEGATSANASRGEKLWNKSFSGKAPYSERSCKTCHGTNVETSGRHVRTNKTIKPLAPSVNPESLSKIKKIKKWFKRNCKWTLGQECSAQQKADILAFLKRQ